MTTAAETVRKCYRLIAAGNFDAAREYWSVDATWHGEFHPRARLGGDQDRDWYFNWFERWATDYPNYSFDAEQQVEFGTQLFGLYMRSRHGEAPGENEGLMLWRVVGEKIVECWAIPGDREFAFAF